MTVDEAAAVTAEAADDIHAWQSLGLLNDGNELTREDVERVRLIGFVARRGIAPAELARICQEQGDMLASFVRWGITPGREVAMSREEAAAGIGVDPELFDTFWFSAGLRDQTLVYEEDLGIMQAANAALQFGLPVEAMVQIVRVLAASLDRVSETMTRVFHLYVHERFRAEGLSGADLMAATQGVADPMTDLVEPVVLYFRRKAWERANREDLLLHLMEETTPPSATVGELMRTILFVDLSSFTPLAEAMGDAVAARIIERFADMVRDIAFHCDGHVVKQIGDEFMLVFPQPESAIAFGVRMHEAAAAEPRFPALRIGAHTGSVLYRDGDYVGANVNLAARIAGAARRHQFLISGDVCRQVSDVDVDPLGQVTLKGVGDPVELFAVHTAATGRAKAPDPVCGMELDDSSSEANLRWRGRQIQFCSQDCLRRFLDAPERYVLAGDQR